MSEDKKEGGEPDAADFDLQLELSSLVADQIIPQSIAEKLEKKLTEKEVQITKDQLYTLAEKIHSLLTTYKEKGTLPEPGKTANTDKFTLPTEEEIESSFSSDDLGSESADGFINKIEELQRKIDNLEKEKVGNSSEKSLDDGKNQIDKNRDFELPYDESINTDHLTTDPLQSIPSNPESIIVLMNWLQYLVNRCGHEQLANVLDYYVEVEWISEDVKIGLLEYATGITAGKTKEGEPDSEDKKQDKLLLHSKDHIQSYLYIQRLKGKKFEKHFVERINGELARIEKKVNNFHHTQ